MNRRLKFAAIGASLIALVGAAGIATAQQDWHRGGHGHGMMMMMRSMMDRYDTNKDGAISQDEINANRTSWHTEFDANKDGNLDLKEFQQLWLKARNEEMVREFQRFDRDGDGKVTLDEYKQPLESTVADMDRNGDGVLNRLDRRGPKGGDRMKQGGMGQDRGDMDCRGDGQMHGQMGPNCDNDDNDSSN